MIKKLIFLPILLSLLTVPIPAQALSKNVVISEVQTADKESAEKEFIELYNLGATPVDVSGWKVVYITASGQTETTLATLHGHLKSHEFLLLGKGGYPADAAAIFDKNLSQTGGHIRLVTQADEEIDRVGWGAAMAPESVAAPVPEAGQSLRRESKSEALFADTDHNDTDFIIDTPAPRGGGLEAIIPPETIECAGVQLNEIFPNPPGADGDGGEYIEVHNASDTPAPLKDCVVATDKAAQLAFPDVTVAPGEYYALTVKDELLNDGGTVRLQREKGEEVAYPAVKEGQAWALADGTWQVTTTPTPGAKNTISKATAGQGSADTPPASLTPCPAGKYRNPETNRCKSEETALQTAGKLAACKPGQERNPATNRCRTVVSTASTAPCAPGQERNPETNRCRKVASSSAENTLKPCPAGQTRNPETNRCRKSEASGTAISQSGQPTDGDGSGTKLHLGILAVAGTAAAGYGLYEYRGDLRNWLSRLRAKDDPTPTSN